MKEKEKQILPKYSLEDATQDFEDLLQTTNFDEDKILSSLLKIQVILIESMKPKQLPHEIFKIMAQLSEKALEKAKLRGDILAVSLFSQLVINYKESVCYLRKKK